MFIRFGCSFSLYKISATKRSARICFRRAIEQETRANENSGFSTSLAMFSKIVILACALAVSNAGILTPVPAAGQYTLTTAALTSTSDNILRSTGNLAQIATQSKTISTPFSTSSKSDIRVTNPAIYAHATPLAYAPTAHAASFAPVAAPPLTPVAAHSSPLLGVAYSPAVAVSHMAYTSPIGVSYSW